jgi:hypothetical protein
MEKTGRSSLYVPNTLVCATVGNIGVPLGVQTDWLSISTSGWPPDITLVAATVHCPVTHGKGLPPVKNGQPAIT